MQSHICVVCDNTEFDKWCEYQKISMYICKKCELVFEYPYPSQDELKTFYNDNYHNQRDYKSLGKIGKLRKKMYELDYVSIKKYTKLWKVS